MVTYYIILIFIVIVESKHMVNSLGRTTYYISNPQDYLDIVHVSVIIVEKELIFFSV